MARRLTPFSKFLLTGLTIFIVLVLFNETSCNVFTNEYGAHKALVEAGYHPISVGGYGFFNCSEDDIYKTKFKAYSPDSSRIVTGCVCEGFFKGKTIHLD